ncbi:universal stress protein [Pedobacter panaciterrae]|uniref:Universal stress protein n=2 Tax=Pedobacter panaciterrae TaxID=363849 RepID=A0ABU8NMA8_9SPHI|nr:universal stress protein [Pedobacter panaciterrae]NQX52981.1 universal stress protein [Pedobacter panaciterrae]
MMKKILVTTDFSTNSKGALRFAMQLAMQSDCQITFFHSYLVPRPSRWSERVFNSFENSEFAKINKKLRRFIAGVYKSLRLSFTEPLHCVAKQGANPDHNIMTFAKENSFDYICISRNGNGKTSRLLGSNTATLIKKSEVPVIAVPPFYKRTEILSICYASDLFDLDDELKKVTSFSTSIDAKVTLLHLKTPLDYLADTRTFNTLTQKLNKHHISAVFDTLDYEKTLIANINKNIKSIKPSILIMFSNQRRTIFEKIFLSSISAEFSSVSKLPLLVFRKK